ncbi:MAG: dTMP kinase [Puniceicoccales bacterium]|jgi:dTMP kinase|nr:dTMP kinase [Puniceicoccales bacterium]
MQKRACFISFEGGEGSGKSTQIALLSDRLRAIGCMTRVLREPGGTFLGEEVRHILKRAPSDPRSELLLFAASRAQLVTEIIRPALADNETVICDRFTDSTIAYQGAGRGLSSEIIATINAFATGGLTPDLTVLLDLPPSAGIARVHARASLTTTPLPPDHIEMLDIAFHERVRTCYLELAAREPERFFVIDARQPQQAIADQIWRHIAEKLGLPLFAQPA